MRFVKTGEPNPDWGRFEGASSPVRIFDRETRTEQLDRRHLMQIWGDMRFYEGLTLVQNKNKKPIKPRD